MSLLDDDPRSADDPFAGGDALRRAALGPVQYEVTQTSRGAWRRYRHPDGTIYADYSSEASLLGLPLLHHTRGRSPETGTWVTARGVVAIGRRAVGIVALGRVAGGVLAVGQLSLGVVAIGQAAVGGLVLGQLALGAVLAIGQVAAAFVTVAQAGLGHWVLAQVGLGEHVWSMRSHDPAAIEFFRTLPARAWHSVTHLFGAIAFDRGETAR
jgi:hypothetical protein